MKEKGDYVMNILQRYFKAFENYFNVSGRASRADYWSFILVNLLITCILEFAPDMVSTIYSLIVFIPVITLVIRRLHDAGRSGWWWLLVFTGIGSIYVLYLMLKPSQSGSNQYGSNPYGR